MKKSWFYTLILSLALLLSACSKHYHVSKVELRSVKTDETTEVNTSIEELIAPYKKELEEKMDVKIGQVAETMEKGKPESTLGNFMADLVHKKCQDYYKRPIDFAVVNYGGIRIPSLPQGEMNKSKVFELMPFDNVLVVLEVDGVTLLELFNAMAKQGGWPISKQIRYEIADGKARRIMIKNKPLDLARTYKVAISDYLANGGDKLSFLINKPRTNLDVLFRDAILEYIVELNDQPIRAKIEGRVVNIED